jgi:hypothetical protein
MTFQNNFPALLKAQLYAVLKNSVNYLDCPLTDEESAAIWHFGVNQDLMRANSLLTHAGMLAAGVLFKPQVKFAMMDRHTGIHAGIRLSARRSSPFFAVPLSGPFAAESIPINGSTWRRLEMQALSELSAQKSLEFQSWVKASCLMSQRQNDAGKTIDDIVDMLSTPGQLRRMVPELTPYLGPDLQRDLAAQTRKSPLPALWAQFDKDRVERMTAALAEGHLFAGMGKRQVNLDLGNYSWAQALPTSISTEFST